jgi:hypothetical protein
MKYLPALLISGAILSAFLVGIVFGENASHRSELPSSLARSELAQAEGEAEEATRWGLEALVGPRTDEYCLNGFPRDGSQGGCITHPNIVLEFATEAECKKAIPQFIISQAQRAIRALTPGVLSSYRMGGGGTRSRRPIPTTRARKPIRSTLPATVI